MTWFVRSLAGVLGGFALLVLVSAPSSVTAGWLVILGLPVLYLLLVFPHRGSLAVVHLVSATVLMALAIGSCRSCGNWPITIPGILLHATVAAVWWFRPGLAIYGTLAATGVSVGMAVFAVQFGYLCGPCFGVHTLMVVSALSLSPRVFRGAGLDRYVALIALPVAIGSITYAIAADIPGLARNPDERAIIALLRDSGLATAVDPKQLQAAPTSAGLLIGDGKASRQLDIVVSVGCPSCVAEWPSIKSVAPLVADGRLQVRLHILPGTAVTDPLPMAMAGYAAIQESPEAWTDAVQAVVANNPDLMSRQTGRVRANAAQLSGLIDQSSRWAAALGLVRSPVFLFRDQGRLVGTYVHLDARSLGVITSPGESP